jgi:hypothetical protein
MVRLDLKSGSHSGARAGKGCSCDSPPAVEGLERLLALPAMALAAVTDPRFEWRQQVEGDVGRLEVAGIGVGDVVNE